MASRHTKKTRLAKQAYDRARDAGSGPTSSHAVRRQQPLGDRCKGGNRSRRAAIGLATIGVVILVGYAVWARQNPAFDPVRPRVSRTLNDGVRSLVDSQIAVVGQSPRSAEAHGTLGLIYEANEMWTEAEASFDIAARLDSRNASWAHHAAVAAYETGDVEDSIARWREVTLHHPSFAPAHHRLGHALLGVGNLEEAGRRLQRTVELQPRMATALTSLADSRLRHGDAAGAVALLEQSKSLDPGYRTTRYLLGLAYRASGRWAEAELELAAGVDARVRYLADEVTSRLSMYVRSTAAELLTAVNLLREGDAAAATKVLEEARRRQPDDANILNYLASAYQSTQRYEDALRVSLETIAGGNPTELTYANLVGTLLFLNRPVEALKQADEGISKFPDRAAVHLAAARVHLFREDYPAGRSALETCLRLDPQQPEVHLTLGRTCRQLFDYGSARIHLEKASQRLPDRIDAHLELAAVCGERKRYDEASAALSRAERIDPNHPQVVLLRARLRQVVPR